MRWQLRTRWLGAFGASCILVAGACGPQIDGDDLYPRNCGEVGPVDLLELPREGIMAGLVGEHVLIRAFSSDGSRVHVMTVPRCGGEPVMLAELDASAPIPIGSAGEYVVRCDPETGAVDWLDPEGRAPSHPLFPATWGCRLHPVAGGLAALDPRDDTIRWHPAPADPTAAARVVGEGARFVTESPGSDLVQCHDRFDRCPLGLRVHPRLGPELAGDVLLVPTPDRAIVELDVRTGSVSAPLLAGVQQLEVMSDPRYVRWHDQDGDDHLLDRQTGSSIRIGRGFSSTHTTLVTDRWIIRTQFSPSIVPIPEDPWTVLWAHHLPSGREHEVTGRDGWFIRGVLADDRVLVDIDPFGPTEGQRFVLHLESGTLIPVDAPGDVVPFGDDLLLYDREPFADFAPMRLLSARDHGVETIAEHVPKDFLVADMQRLIYVDRPELSEAGMLRTRRPDGAWFEIDADVVDVLWADDVMVPRLEPVEAREIVYVAHEEDHQVVRRTVLP